MSDINTEMMTYLDKFIKTGQKSPINLDKLYDTVLIENGDRIYRTPIDDFFLRYHTQLEEIVMIYSCPEQYFYKPKMLSLSLYGTTELWLALLRVNNMMNITEFHMPFIQVYEPNATKQLINLFFKREGVN